MKLKGYHYVLAGVETFPLALVLVFFAPLLTEDPTASVGSIILEVVILLLSSFMVYMFFMSIFTRKKNERHAKGWLLALVILATLLWLALIGSIIYID